MRFIEPLVGCIQLGKPQSSLVLFATVVQQEGAGLEACTLHTYILEAPEAPLTASSRDCQAAWDSLAPEGILQGHGKGMRSPKQSRKHLHGDGA